MSVLAHAGPAGAWAWAGLRLAPEPAIHRNGAHVGLPEAQRRREAADLEQVWLSRHWQPDGRAFELRYTTAPGSAVACTLLCRMPGPDGRTASAAALALRDALADCPRHVRAEPIEDVGELHTALVPFGQAPTRLAEVRKRLSWAWLQRQDVDFRLGVAVAPLVGEAVSWEPVWEALARAGAPTVAAVCLEPCAPPPELLSYLGYLAREYGRLCRPGRPNPVFTQYIPPDPFALRAAPLYHDALAALSGRAYRLRVSLAGAGAGDAVLPLAEQVAATLAPPTASPGAAVARAVAPHETADAWTNLTGMQRTWLDTTYRQEVPQPLGEWEKLLTDLVDLPQAAAAFRFPYEVPGRPPLFATPRRSAAPREAGSAPAAPGSDPYAPNF
ncbi:hypothetical protein ABT168_15005 [Streptomyces sp. NPDC001793]|uniref:hypothetical protein n=1 Tax=Streptomyces sp. NPDC001793 TaxID=3154657 RepID=UPI00332082ED